MKNRTYKQFLFNGCVLLMCAPIFLAHANTKEAVGNALLAGVCFLVGATLLVIAPNFKEPPPHWNDIRNMMRGFYERMLS